MRSYQQRSPSSSSSTSVSCIPSSLQMEDDFGFRSLLSMAEVKKTNGEGEAKGSYFVVVVVIIIIIIIVVVVVVAVVVVVVLGLGVYFVIYLLTN